jgi:type VI protein secretion system component Hcp
MRASLDGSQFPEVVLTAAKSLSDTGPGSTVSYVYFTVIMNDVGVLSASSNVNAGDERQTEDVVFCIGKLTAEYTPYDKDGKSGAPTDWSWDITKNKKN